MAYFCRFLQIEDDDENQVQCFARILATTTANTAAAHLKMNLQHYYKTLHGSKADPVELNLKTMILGFYHDNNQLFL